MEPYLQIMRERVRKDRRQTLLVAAVCAALGMLLFWFVPVSSSDDSSSRLLITAIAVAGGLYFGWQGLQPVDRHPGIAALAKGGGDIVWLYVQRMTRGGMHSASRLHLGLTNRKLVWLDVPKERDDEFLQWATKLVPHATSGYDPDFEKQFVRDPASLRRS
jgi:hypothetical protein